MSTTTTENVNVSILFHQDRINQLKAQRSHEADGGNWELYEAITQRIRENEEIIRELTT